MNWLALIALEVLFYSISIFIDNYTSDTFFRGRGAASQKLFFGYAFTIFGIVIALIFGIDFEHASWINLCMFFLTGVLSTVAGFPFYRALELDDSTNLSIFVQLAPVLYLIFGWLFLGEKISVQQLIAFIIILAGPFFVIASSKKNRRKRRIRGALMAALYVLITVSGNLIFVTNSVPGLSFATPSAMLFLGKGISNLVFMYCSKRYRKRFRDVAEKNGKKLYIPLTINAFACLVKDITGRVALCIAPTVAFASAISDSGKPIVMFLMGIILSIIWPEFGREKISKKSVSVHLIATVLVVVGIILLQA